MFWSNLLSPSDCLFEQELTIASHIHMFYAFTVILMPCCKYVCINITVSECISSILLSWVQCFVTLDSGQSPKI